MGTNFRTAGALLLLPALFLCGCGRRSAARDAWQVIALSLPEKISIADNKATLAGYVFRQTHEPLFRHEDGQNYTSRILASWSRSLDHREFLFCPKQELTFDGREPFSAGFLEKFLSKLTGRYYSRFLVSAENGCVRVNFSGGQPGYLQFLAKYSNAPSVEGPLGSVGLGAFRITEISKRKIELARKVPVKRGYNRIVFHQYAGPEDPKLADRAVSDFNLLGPAQKPKWLESEFRGLFNVELKSINLAINHPDARVRRAIYNCTDIYALRKVISPKRKEFYDIATLLPVGVPGAKGGLPEQRCVRPAELKGTRVVFANPQSENRKELERFMAELGRKTGFTMQIKDYRPEQMNPMLLDGSHRKPFNLVIAATGSTEPEQDDFFEYFAGDKPVLDHVPASVRKSFRALRAESDPAKKQVLAERLANELGSEGIILPLYQSMAKLYYPPEIKNLVVGRGFLESPDIGSLRW